MRRYRNRYIAARVVGGEKLDKDGVERELRAALPNTYLKAISYGKTAIFRTNPKGAEMLRAALPRVTQISGHRIHMQPVMTSGTLRALRERLGIPLPKKRGRT